MLRSLVMSKFIKRNSIIFVFFGVLLVYLINANSIILFFDSSVSKFVFVDVDQIKSNSNIQIAYALDEFEISNDMLQTVNASGWAFCKSSLKNHKREIRLIFKSNTENTPDYAVCIPATLRRDFLATFIEQADNAMAGIEAKFSTITMKNGIYTLYLQVVENDTLSGVICTDRYYEKRNSSFQKVRYISVDNITQTVEYTSDFKLALGEQYIDSDILKVNGWAFLLNKNCNQQKVYIKFVNSDKECTYRAIPQSRPDVVKAYGRDLYELSGFHLEIPVNELPFIPEQFEIIIELENKFYTRSVIYDIQNMV